jgi:DNA-directed RNA polymerase subunit K/omega
MSRITRFEIARLVTARALQLSFGAPPLVKAESGMSAYGLAKFELVQGVLPLAVIRRYPDGSLEKIAV